MTKEQAITELLNYDHCFIWPDEADKIAKAFGTLAECYTEQCDYDNPKGLHFADRRKSAFGIAAEVLARQICEHLHIEYPYKVGRGFQLRACCQALTDHIKAQRTITP